MPILLSARMRLVSWLPPSSCIPFQARAAGLSWLGSAQSDVIGLTRSASHLVYFVAGLFLLNWLVGLCCCFFAGFPPNQVLTGFFTCPIRISPAVGFLFALTGCFPCPVCFLPACTFADFQYVSFPTLSLPCRLPTCCTLSSCSLSAGQSLAKLWLT